MNRKHEIKRQRKLAQRNINRLRSVPKPLLHLIHQDFLGTLYATTFNTLEHLIEFIDLISPAYEYAYYYISPDSVELSFDHKFSDHRIRLSCRDTKRVLEEYLDIECEEITETVPEYTTTKFQCTMED